MKFATTMLATLLLTGCHLLATAPRTAGAVAFDPDPECVKLDDAFVAWSTAAAITGGFAAGTTAAIGAVEAWNGPHSDDAVLALSIAAETTSILSLAAGIIAGYYAERFGTTCSPEVYRP